LWPSIMALGCLSMWRCCPPTPRPPANSACDSSKPWGITPRSSSPMAGTPM
jgi:hypothetical protein